jgi:hypothetical protein
MAVVFYAIFSFPWLYLAHNINLLRWEIIWHSIVRAWDSPPSFLHDPQYGSDAN